MFFLQDFRGSHLTHRKSNLIEKKEKIDTFSPPAVQRETTIDIVDPVVPIDIPRNLTLGHKRYVWKCQEIQNKTCSQRILTSRGGEL
jgi:hypothetical protein